MQQLAKVLKDMQLAGNPHQTDLLYGVVESVDPLSISVDARFTITSDFVELGNAVKDLSTNPPTLLLEVGQTIRLIRYSQGQKYLALEIVDVEKEIEVIVDYNDLNNKPILDTDNSTQLLVQAAEVLKGVIKLHKISKTGNYVDLNNKPTIPTKLSQLATDTNNQRVSEAEKASWATIAMLNSLESTLNNTIATLQGNINNKADKVHKHNVADINNGIFGYGVQSQRTHIADTRSVNNTPQWYTSNYPHSKVIEFKQASTIGLSVFATGTYMAVETIVPWSSHSADHEVKQVAWGNNNEAYFRTSTSATTWKPWTALNLGGELSTT